MYYYNKCKENELPEWREGCVDKVVNNIIEIKTGRKLPNARVVLEDIRVLPKYTLARELIIDGSIKYRGRQSGQE